MLPAMPAQSRRRGRRDRPGPSEARGASTARTRFRTRKTAAATIAATKSGEAWSAGADRADLDGRRRPRRPGAPSPAWFASVPYQGISPRSSRESRSCRSLRPSPPTAGPPRNIDGHDRCDRDGLLSSTWQLHREGGSEQASGASRRRCPSTMLELGSGAGPSGREPSAIAGIGGKHKSRSHERNGAQSHDSSDVELEGLRHRLPRTLVHYPEL